MVMMSAAMAMFMMMPAAASAFRFVMMVMAAAAFTVSSAAAALRQFFSYFRLIDREESFLIAFQGQNAALLSSVLMMMVSAMAFSVAPAAFSFFMMVVSAVALSVAPAASPFFMMVVMTAVTFSMTSAAFSLLMMVVSAMTLSMAAAAFSFLMMVMAAVPLSVAPAAFPFPMMMVSAVALAMAAAAFSFFRFRPVQVGHVMVVIFMGCIQQDVKAAAVDARFLHSGDFDIKTGCRNRPECFFQRFPVCAQIQQSCCKHIAGNPGVGFQIKFLFHSYIFLSARRLICVAT
jgi:hypothetical protein